MIGTLAGFLLVIAGIALALWTNSVLGWRRLLWLSDEPPHPALPQLVFAGPYRVVRHPFFLSMLMVFGGATAATRSLACAAAFLLASVLVAVLAWQEERRLVIRFGEAYRRYQRVVPFLLPWPRRPLTASP